jgi:Zn-dependent membrane protease YugP
MGTAETTSKGEMFMYGMYGYGYGYGFDPTIILVLIGVALSLWAQGRVNSTFSRYSRVRSMTGMTGAEAARRLLNAQGIYDVTVQPIAGELTDHYDPRTKTVNLSQSVYGATSVAAIGVAAHECGHAMQDNEGYAPLRFRSALVPAANFGSKLSWPLILLGLVFGGLGSPLVEIGILMFSLAVLFQLVTLPVEYNASARAVRLLDSQGILAGEEVSGTRKVLNAAALTYVAAAATSILQLLRLIILFGGRNRRDN